MRQHAAVPRRRRAGLPGARLLVLLAALAGLFAMHGMSDHGTTHHGVSPSSAAPDRGAAGMIMSHDGAVDGVQAAGAVVPDAAQAAAIGTAVVVDAVTAAVEAHGGGAHVAAGLCLAVLAGAVALAMRRLPLRPHPLTRARHELGSRMVVSQARAPDPPDLHALCIQRC